MTNDLQKDIDLLQNGGKLQLKPTEYEGPIHIRKSIEIDGQGSAIWRKEKGPVLFIEAEGVVLRNLGIEVTGRSDFGGFEADCAILVRALTSPHIENVAVRGSVIGLQEEAGVWLYPHTLNMNPLMCGINHVFTIVLIVPVPCTIQSDIAGVSVTPGSLIKGINMVSLNFDSLPEDILLNGNIYIITPLLKRMISICAPIMKKDETGVTNQGQVIWVPKIPEKTIRPQELFKYTMPITGAGVSSVKVEVEGLPEFAVFDDKNFELKFNPSIEQADSSYLIKFKIITDKDNIVIEFPIRVENPAPAPPPPVWNIRSPITGNVGETLKTTIDNPDSSRFRLHLSSGATPLMSVQFDQTSGELSWELKEENAGNHTLIIDLVDIGSRTTVMSQPLVVEVKKVDKIIDVDVNYYEIYRQSFLWIYNLILFVAGLFAVLTFMIDYVSGLLAIIIAEGAYLFISGISKKMQEFIKNH